MLTLADETVDGLSVPCLLPQWVHLQFWEARNITSLALLELRKLLEWKLLQTISAKVSLMSICIFDQNILQESTREGRQFLGSCTKIYHVIKAVLCSTTNRSCYGILMVLTLPSNAADLFVLHFLAATFDQKFPKSPQSLWLRWPSQKSKTSKVTLEKIRSIKYLAYANVCHMFFSTGIHYTPEI